MMCELPTLLALGECQGRMGDWRYVPYPAGMMWALSSQVTGRVAAKSKGLSANCISTSSFWGEGGDDNLFLIFSLPPIHLEAQSPTKTKVTVGPIQTAIRRWGHGIVKAQEHICGSFGSCFYTIISVSSIASLGNTTQHLCRQMKPWKRTLLPLESVQR